MENSPKINSINVLINGKDITLKMTDAKMLRDILVDLLGPSTPNYAFGPISDNMPYTYTDADGTHHGQSTSDWPKDRLILLETPDSKPVLTSSSSGAPSKCQ